MALVTGRDAGLDTESADAEALFKEAKRRERHRWMLVGAAFAVVLLAATTLIVVSGGSTRPTPTHTTGLHKAKPIVNATAFAHHGLLAFVSHGELWVLDGFNGSLRQVKSSGADAVDPTFSADGKWLAYLVEPYASSLNAPPGQLWIARSNGTDAHPVKQLGEASELSWSPRNDVLAAVENPLNGAVPATAANAPPSAIWLASPTGRAHVLAGSLHAMNFVWSPDGREIAFAGYYQFGSLDVVSAAGGTPLVWFLAPYNPGYPDAYNPTIPTEWLLSGGILFWIDPDDSASIEADGLKLYEVRSPGGQAITLGTTLTSTGSLTADVNGHFAIVSGGNRYAWQTKEVEICANTSATCMPVPAPTSDVTFDPSWSPNGSTLAFIEAPSLSFGTVSQQAVESWYAEHSLWIVGAGSGQPTSVGGTSGASVPVWSANGKSLLYEANDGLWLVPALAKHPVEIATPLFPVDQWPSYYAQVDWTGQFNWWSS